MGEKFEIKEHEASEFLKKLKFIRHEIMDNLSIEDYNHYKDFRKKLTLFKILGYSCAPFCPNIFSALGFGVARVGNWITMHHVSHKGYDNVPGYPERLKSKTFAKGKRRYVDWLDWMLPEAWAYEHNILHHSYTGESQDPDIPENKIPEFLYDLSSLTYYKIKFDSKSMKLMIFISAIMTWRLRYYAPNTLFTLFEKEKKIKFKKRDEMFFSKDFWLKCFAPYSFYNFVLTPMFYFPLGPIAMYNVFLNSLLGEIISNVYAFTVIVTNHAGEDVYKYNCKTNSHLERIFRQIIGSVNYKTGGNWNDFFHMYLNYQIEHHIWPDMPMSAYQKAQPKVKKLCEEYNIPYIQENIFSRLKKTYSNMMGITKMKEVEKVVMPS